MNLLRNVQVIGPVTQPTPMTNKTTMYGPAVDMSDCDGVLFIAIGDTEFASKIGVGTMSAQMASSTGVAAGNWSHYGATNLCVISSATAPGTVSDRIVALDFYRPQIMVPTSNIKRTYARAALGLTTGNFVAMCAIKYGLRNPGATGWYSSEYAAFGTIVGATKNT